MPGDDGIKVRGPVIVPKRHTLLFSKRTNVKKTPGMYSHCF